MVIGVPDDETGQAVFAYVQFKKGISQPSKEALTAYAFANLADHKVPKYWHFTKKFEVSGIVDKIDRKKLAQEARTHISS